MVRHTIRTRMRDGGGVVSDVYPSLIEGGPMRSHRTFVLALVVVTSFTLLAVACSGNFNESTPAGPTAVGGVAPGVGGVAIGGGTVSLAGRTPNVDVCHVTGNGSFQLLNVNGNALSAHLNHGDGVPDSPVLGSDPPKQFDDACVLVDVPPTGPPSCEQCVIELNACFSTAGGDPVLQGECKALLQPCFFACVG